MGGPFGAWVSNHLLKGISLGSWVFGYLLKGDSLGSRMFGYLITQDPLRQTEGFSKIYNSFVPLSRIPEHPDHIPRTVSNNASTRTAMRAESDGE